MATTVILTPENSPNHDVVGRDFMGWTGIRYYCDSYDPRRGYWMTPRCPSCRNAMMRDVDERRNVSERAVGGTFHRIWTDTENGKARESVTSGFLDALRAWNTAHPNGDQCQGYERIRGDQ